MQKKEFNKARIQLTYIYISCIENEFGEVLWQNISVNLRKNITVAYDPDKGDLKIKRTGERLLNYWSVSCDKDLDNISDMTLILGENGIGKTTLLNAICAGTIESINDNLGSYLLVYSIENSDEYYVKSRNLPWYKELQKNDAENNENEMKSYLYTHINEINDGYQGLINFNEKGELCLGKSIDKWEKKRDFLEGWSILPMEYIYIPLPFSTGHNDERFFYTRSINDFREASVVNVLKYLVDSEIRGSNPFISKKPWLSIICTSDVKNLTKYHEVYEKYSHSIYTALKLTKMTRHGKIYSSFDIEKIKTNSERKYMFFSNIVIRHILRLAISQYEYNENDYFIKNIINNIDQSYSNMADLFHKLSNTLLNCSIINEKKVLKVLLQKWIDSIIKLSEDLFTEDSISGYVSRMVWGIRVSELVNGIEDEIYEFINLSNEFNDVGDIELRKRFSSCFIQFKLSGMSSGEFSLISNVFSKINAGMRRIESNDKAQYKKNILLIMDEPDVAFHIRWTQKFVFNLIQYLQTHFKKYYFQIIMTSHMPFMATDFPKDNIICLTGKEWIEEYRGEHIDWADGNELMSEKGAELLQTSNVRIIRPKYGLMSNYYDIVRDTFFVDEPIGDFARHKYIQLGKKIERINSETSEKLLEDIKKEIDMIDEPILQGFLLEDYDTKNEKTLNIKELEQEVSELEKYMKELNYKIYKMKTSAKKEETE